MSYCFKKSEPPFKAVRRVCCERISAARAGLRHCERPSAVHGVRKEIKKLRAALRLVRGEIGHGDFRKLTKALRAVANCLATPRDARVTLKAFEKLTGDSARQFAGVEKSLREHCRRESRRFRKEDAGTIAGRLLRKVNRRITGLKNKSDGWATIEPGLRHSYRRGRDAWQTVRQEPSPENLHEWRKQVKNLWWHLRLLCPAWPPPTRAMMDKLEGLGEWLGDDHDLVLLKQFVAEHCAGQTAEAAALNQLIKSRQEKLRAAASKLGVRLYGETAAAVCTRLGNHWNAWRGGVTRH